MKISRALLDAACEAAGIAVRLDRPADTVLSEFFRNHPHLGSHDRPFVADTVFSVIRHKRLLEAIVGNAEPRRLVLASLLKLQGMSLGALRPVTSESDQAWLLEAKQWSASAAPPAIRLSLPDWLWQRLETSYGSERAQRLGSSLLQPAPLDLRVNTLLSTRDVVIDALAGSGIEAQPTPYSPIGVRVTGKPAVNRHELFLTGAVEVQDEGSQLLGLLLAPSRRQMVVDFCAGAGGKTLLLGAMMRNQGRLYAFDVSAKRLESLRQRLKRSQLSNVHPQLIGSERDPRIKRLAGKIDRVLVDAPCSGLGTLRRNPDMKWRQSPQSVSELVDKQRRILAASSALLKPGGRLVYATCSLLADENEQIVSDFMAARAGQFRLLDCQAALESQKVSGLGNGPYLHLAPDTHRCDGFFAALLERTAPA